VSVVHRCEAELVAKAKALTQKFHNFAVEHKERVLRRLAQLRNTLNFHTQGRHHDKIAAAHDKVAAIVEKIATRNPDATPPAP
jgi:hypothetical protein